MEHNLEPDMVVVQYRCVGRGLVPRTTKLARQKTKQSKQYVERRINRNASGKALVRFDGSYLLIGA